MGYVVSSTEKKLFQEKLAGVRRLSKDTHMPPASPPTKTPRAHKTSTAENTPDFEEVLDKTVTNSSSLQSDELVFFCRSGVRHKLIRHLKRGKILTDAKLDLHGLTRKEAIHELKRFLKNSRQFKWRCVKIIHGKGRSSSLPPVLKNLVCDILTIHPMVLAFCSARPNSGGTGAVHVLLRR